MEGAMTEAPHAAVVVWVIGDISRVAGVDMHLPASWSVRSRPDVGGVGDDGLVLLVCPSIADVAAIDPQLPRRPQLVVLLDESSPAAAVAAVLEAGADMCVSTRSSAILAGHLMACGRRLMQINASR
jgi:hypothetical protein